MNDQQNNLNDGVTYEKYKLLSDAQSRKVRMKLIKKQPINNQTKDQRS